MNDQEQFDGNALSKLLLKVIPSWSNEFTENTIERFQKYLDLEKSQWKGESAMILIDKLKHSSNFRTTFLLSRYYR